MCMTTGTRPASGPSFGVIGDGERGAACNASPGVQVAVEGDDGAARRAAVGIVDVVLVDVALAVAGAGPRRRWCSRRRRCRCGRPTGPL